MYKSVTLKEEEPAPSLLYETIVVADSEEQKKKEGQGYSTDVAKPKESDKKPEAKHDEKPISHEHNKKS